VEFYLATKNNEILSFTGKWMELENIISGSEGKKPHVLLHMQIIHLNNAAIL
jgi:hypothetical protein